MNNLYKTKGDFGRILQNRKIINEKEKKRRKSRNNHLMNLRNIDPNMSPCTPQKSKNEYMETIEKPNDKVKERLEMLARWKEEKKKKQDLEKAKKKPIFKVQHVRVEIGLPNLDNLNKIKGKSFALPNHKFKPPSNLKNDILLGPSAGPVTRSQTGATQKTRTKKANDPEKATSKETNSTKIISKNKTSTKVKPPSTTTKNDELDKKGDKDKKEETDLKESFRKMSLTKKISSRIKSKSSSKSDKELDDQLNSILSDHCLSNNDNNLLEEGEKDIDSPEIESRAVLKEKNQNISLLNVPNFHKQEKLLEKSFQTPIKLAHNYISPHVTISRGKDKARKEFFTRQINDGISPEHYESTSPAAAADYFTQKLKQSITDIQNLNNKWETFRDNENDLEEAAAIINTAVGQSNLLISKKCVQFANLIEACRNNANSNEMVVTCKDLHGYWDLLYLEFKNVFKRFEYLDQLKENNWEEIMPDAKKPSLPKKTRNVNKSKKPAKASSSLREAIKAARMKKNAENLEATDIVLTTIKSKTPVRQSKQSPKSVERWAKSSDKKKRLSSGLAIMKATELAKHYGTPEEKSILIKESKSSIRKTVAFLDSTQADKNNESFNRKYSLRSGTLKAKLF